MQKATVEVSRGDARVKIPEPGSIVIARITKVNPRLASASLLCINTQPLSDKFTGIIRHASRTFYSCKVLFVHNFLGMSIIRIG